MAGTWNDAVSKWDDVVTTWADTGSGPTTINATWNAVPKAVLTLGQLALAQKTIIFSPHSVLSQGTLVTRNVTIIFSPRTTLFLGASIFGQPTTPVQLNYSFWGGGYVG